jgi:hypothetical protein
MDDTPQPGSRVVAKPRRWYKLRFNKAGREESVNSSPQQTDRDKPTSLARIDKGSREEKPPSTSNNLWKRTYDELGADKDNRIWIERYENIVKSIANDDENIPKDSTVKEKMEAVVRTRMKIMTNRQWVLQWGSKSINLRQQVDNIVKVIQRGSSIGSQIASLDPTYGSIAWTGICIVLPVRNPRFRSFRLICLANPQRLRAE